MNVNKCQQTVDEILAEYFIECKYDPRIKSALEYVTTGGKRLRSMITLAILDKCNCLENYRQLCLIPEFIHTASLVVDDLPAFDNATIRREQTCVHLEYGEGVAYLLSFALVTESFKILQEHIDQIQGGFTTEQTLQRYKEQIKLLTESIGVEKALAGQLLSTFHTHGITNMREIYSHELLSKEAICEILEKKTSSFFEIALVVGWIFGGRDLTNISKVQELSRVCGLCYQIYDDFEDYSEDVLQDDHFSHNYVYHRGAEQAMADYYSFREEMNNLISELDLECPVLTWFGEYMDNKILSTSNVNVYSIPFIDVDSDLADETE